MPWMSPGRHASFPPPVGNFESPTAFREGTPLPYPPSSLRSLEHEGCEEPERTIGRRPLWLALPPMLARGRLAQPNLLAAGKKHASNFPPLRTQLSPRDVRGWLIGK